jgi:hypothetical protein
VLAVDTAMKMWAAYVVAGHATPAQEAEVRAKYQSYQDVASLAEVALTESSRASATSDLATAAVAIVKTVQSFLELAAGSQLEQI